MRRGAYASSFTITRLPKENPPASISKISGTYQKNNNSNKTENLQNHYQTNREGGKQVEYCCQDQISWIK